MTSAFELYQRGGHPVPDDVTKPVQALTLQDHARRILFEYIKARMEKTDTHVTFKEDDVYCVWFSKTLQNWKAMLSTTLPDGMYYELTHDGDKKQTYIDAYKKWDNVAVPDTGLDF